MVEKVRRSYRPPFLENQALDTERIPEGATVQIETVWYRLDLVKFGPLKRQEEKGRTDGGEWMWHEIRHARRRLSESDCSEWTWMFVRGEPECQFLVQVAVAGPFVRRSEEACLNHR